MVLVFQEWLGSALADGHDVDTARRLYDEKLPGAEPAHRARFLYGLAMWRYFRHGDLEGALACFRDAAEVVPQYESYLGDTLWRLGRREEAIEHHLTRSELFPDSRYLREACLALLGVGRFEEAIRAAERAAEHCPAAKPCSCDERTAFARDLRRIRDRIEREGVGFVPDGPQERLRTALVLRITGRYEAAWRLLRAIAEETGSVVGLERKLSGPARFREGVEAASAAARVATETESPEAARADARRDALAWLRSALDEAAAWVKGRSEGERQRQHLYGQLFPSRSDPALARFRDDEVLARLPAEEAEAWRKLWADLDALIAELQW
jgi:tetratricopeptide (TPR) repeat protein